MLPISALFAFDSDLTGSGKTELQRYLEAESASGAPGLRMICVVGRGCWWWTGSRWDSQKATPDADEILRMLGVLLNSIQAYRKREIPLLPALYLTPLSES